MGACDSHLIGTADIGSDHVAAAAAPGTVFTAGGSFSSSHTFSLHLSSYLVTNGGVTLEFAHTRSVTTIGAHPNAITGIAVAPDGASVYLLITADTGFEIDQIDFDGGVISSSTVDGNNVTGLSYNYTTDQLVFLTNEVDV